MANGHPIVMMPEHVGPSLPKSMYFQKPYGHHRPAHHFKMTFDVKNQKIYCVQPKSDGERVTGSGDDEKKSNNNAAVTVVNGNTRKGRPRGSKNKSTISSFNDHCEKRSFTYTFTSPAKCKSCDRTFEDPLLHCLEYHHTVCPVCGRTYKPPLTTHIKSHKTRQVSLTVECYQCYDCKEKFGNASAMAEHVLDEHLQGDKQVNLGESSMDAATCCKICGATFFPNFDGLREHVSEMHLNAEDTSSFPDRCGYCDEQTGRDRLVEHITEKHLQKTAVVDLKCMLCGVQFADRAAVVSHLVDAHCPQKTFSHPAVYRCRVCQAGFKSQINVLRHACNKIKTPYCELCNKSFPSKMRYSFHLQFHEHPRCAPMHLRCDLCLAEFEDEYHLYDHIRFRHELHDKAMCEVCGRTFKSTMGLNIHRRYHNGLRNFACRLCNKSFLNKSTLKEHEISHMDVKPFQCHICGQYLSRASRLRSHVKTHKAAESTDQRCYSCVYCGFVAPSIGLLEEHRDKQHVSAGTGVNDGGQWTPNTVYLSSVVKCEFCDSTYVSSTHLNEHRDTAHANCSDSSAEAFICVVCSSTFSTYSRLTTHKLTHGINMESMLPAYDDKDADEASEETSVQQQRQQDRDRFDIPQFFSCQYCSKKCLHYTYFCLHRRLKHPLGVQTHACDKCFLNFKTSWRLTYHKKTVHGHQSEKPPEKYECSVCYRKFVKIGALNLHKTRTHIDIVGDICKYLCHQCGKFFSTQCSLRNHTKLHENNGSAGDFGKRSHKSMVTSSTRRKTYRKKSETTTKPIKLEKSRHQFDETIDANSNSIKQVNSHMQLYPVTSYPSGVVCVLCEKTLMNSVQLRFHLENHAARNEAFLCTTCSVPFLSSAALEIHLNSHNCEPNAFVHAPQNSDIKFVGVLKNQFDGQPLVVDCSKIFYETANTTVPTTTSPLADTTAKNSTVPVNAFMSPVSTTAVQTAPTSVIKTIAPISNMDPESFILDELLSILSTPRSSAALDNIEFTPPNDLNDIFKSICDTN